MTHLDISIVGKKTDRQARRVCIQSVDIFHDDAFEYIHLPSRIESDVAKLHETHSTVGDLTYFRLARVFACFPVQLSLCVSVSRSVNPHTHTNRSSENVFDTAADKCINCIHIMIEKSESRRERLMHQTASTPHDPLSAGTSVAT